MYIDNDTDKHARASARARTHTHTHKLANKHTHTHLDTAAMEDVPTRSLNYRPVGSLLEVGLHI